MNLNRAKTEFEKIAKEEIQVENICGTYYTFGTELACHRLFYAYRNSLPKIDVNFSKNRNSWYFRLEP